MSKFSESEKFILNLFPKGTVFLFEGKSFEVIKSGKPTCDKGEPKTDIYIKALSSDGIKKEFKISYKQENADFLENKTNAQRARQIFGKNRSEIITDAISNIKDNFLNKSIIYKKTSGKTEEGCITLGWKFELLNKKSGDLSAEVMLNEEQIIDVYAGTHLDENKRHAFIGNEVIYNSGVANYLLFSNVDDSITAQKVIDNIIPIEDYVKKEKPKIFFACKALNYRTKRINKDGVLEPKYDGNRPLSVYIEWSTKNDMLNANLIFNQPLEHGGNDAYDQLHTALKEMGVFTTDDLNDENVNPNIKIKK